MPEEEMDDEKLRRLAEEVSRLEFEKMRLMKEKELKLKKVNTQLGLISPSVQAKHPIISTIASKIGRGGYEAAKNLGEGITILGNKAIKYAKEEREKNLAREKYLFKHPKIAKRLEYEQAKRRYQEELANPLNRVVGYKPEMPLMPKEKPKTKRKKKATKHIKRKAKTKSLSELREEVQRKQYEQKLRRLAEA